MASAPNRINPLAGPVESLAALESLIADRHLWVPVGPPEATLSVSIIEPKGGVFSTRHRFGAARNLRPRPSRCCPKPGRCLMRLSRRLGRSPRTRPFTGRFLTYGVREAQDISQVIDALDQQQLIAGEIGVLGISYGATTSIHLAACDPRVQAVVAVEPFGMVRPEIRQFGYVMAPEIAYFSVTPNSSERWIERARWPDSIPTAPTPSTPSSELGAGSASARYGRLDRALLNSVVLEQAAPDHCERVPIPPRRPRFAMV